jgi:hypothetical protein
MRKNIIIVVLVAVLGLFGYNQYQKQDINYKKEVVNSKIDMEADSPNIYINYDISYRKRLLHSGYEVYFTIVNNSKFTTYKDFNFKLKSVGNSGTLIGTEKVTLYEQIKPGKKLTTSYKTKKISKKYQIQIETLIPSIVE